jgi:CRP-like cAMP-binding protein
MFKLGNFKSKKSSIPELSFGFFDQDTEGALSRREQTQLMAYMHKRTYKSGEIIFLQGDPATGMYVLTEGQVEILYEQEVLEYQAEEGTVFGLFSIDADTNRWYSLRAKTNCVVYGLFRPDFETISSREPKLAFKMIRYANKKAVLLLASIYEKMTDKMGGKESLEILLKHY